VSSGIRLRTDRLLLRPYRVTDVDDLLAIRCDPGAVRYRNWGMPDRVQVEDAVRTRMVMDRLVSPGDCLVLAAEVRGRVVGDVSLDWVSAEHAQGQISFAFHSDVHGRGYASEAAGAVLDLAFDHVQLHRVSGSCDARNTVSAALMRRLGMRQEAHFVHSEAVGGDWGDELVFAVLEDEWRSRRRVNAPPPS